MTSGFKIIRLFIYLFILLTVFRFFRWKKLKQTNNLGSNKSPEVINAQGLKGPKRW